MHYQFKTKTPARVFFLSLEKKRVNFLSYKMSSKNTKIKNKGVFLPSEREMVFISHQKD